MEVSRLTRDGTAEPVSRDQIFRHERGQGNIHFSCSADHVQDWQPYPVDPYSCYMCDHTYTEGILENWPIVLAYGTYLPVALMVHKLKVHSTTIQYSTTVIVAYDNKWSPKKKV